MNGVGRDRGEQKSFFSKYEEGPTKVTFSCTYAVEIAVKRAAAAGRRLRTGMHAMSLRDKMCRERESSDPFEGTNSHFTEWSTAAGAFSQQSGQILLKNLLNKSLTILKSSL